MTSIIEYLSGLSQNNNREWYHANKAQYKQANADFEGFIGDLITVIGQYDPSILHNNPKDLTFKLVRDTRYSHDKSPYNPTFRAHIASNGKLPIPVGYFISLSPGGKSFLGGGLFADMFKDATTMIRDYIAANGSVFATIMNDDGFIRNFRTVKGETLKKVPAGYDASHPQVEYFKFKSWYLEYPVTDEQLVDKADFIQHAADIFKLMKPFNDYLNAALKDFEMPSR